MSGNGTIVVPAPMLAVVSTGPSPSSHAHRIAGLVMRLGERTSVVAQWLVPVLTGAAALLTAAVGWSVWFFIAGAVAAAAAIVLQLGQNSWRRSIERQRDLDTTNGLEALVEQHGIVADAFSEIATAAAQMADMGKTDRETQFKVLVTQAVNAIAWVVHGDVPGLRAVVYSVTDAGTRMVPIAWTSVGHRKPPTPFEPGTDRGEKALAVLHRGESLFVDDISKAPELWAGSGDGYNTFITTPITSRTDAYGLLTVDAPLTDDLTEEDENDLRLIAGILAMVFGEYLRRSPGRVAEISR